MANKGNKMESTIQVLQLGYIILLFLFLFLTGPGAYNLPSPGLDATVHLAGLTDVGGCGTMRSMIPLHTR